jgi:hypothetical protein
MDAESYSPDHREQENRDGQAAPNLNKASPGLTEDAALGLVKNADVTAEALARLAKNPIASKSRKLVVALASHPRTPRHVSIPLLRGMFTFDLMNFALTPTVAPDLKLAAEEQLIMRLESLPVGQKITLARRASGRVAAALLQTPDQKILSPALDNKQITEALVVQALMKPRAPERLYVLVSHHLAWQLRREIQIALLRSEKTPPERAQEFAKNFSREFLQEMMPGGRSNLMDASEFDARSDRQE